MGTALVRHDGEGLQRARSWSAMPADERRRAAAAAAQAHDLATLRELADAWLTLHGAAGATVSPHTRSSYRHGVAVLIAAWRAETLLHPRRDAAALWLREMEDAGLKPATVRTRLAAARTLYAALRWSGATDANPFTDARPARDRTAAKDRRRPYAPDELGAVLTLLDTEIAAASPAAQTMARYDKALILLGAHAGLRVSEMLDLRWDDLDVPRRTIVVRRGKGGKRRDVAMSASLAATLEAIPPATRGAFVLPYRARSSAWTRVRNLTIRAGVNEKKTGLHRLRHAAGTRMMAETHDLQEVAELLGHTQLDTARVYAQWANDTQRRTVGQW